VSAETHKSIPLSEPDADSQERDSYRRESCKQASSSAPSAPLAMLSTIAALHPLPAHAHLLHPLHSHLAYTHPSSVKAATEAVTSQAHHLQEGLCAILGLILAVAPLLDLDVPSAAAATDLAAASSPHLIATATAATAGSTAGGASLLSTLGGVVGSLPLGATVGIDLEGADAMDRSNTPLWAKLVGLIAANVLIIQGVLALLRRAGDKSEPVTLVRIQLGLVTEHSAIRSKLGQLASMITAGQTGQWLILEEAVLELSKHRSTCALADVTAVTLESKAAGYDLFKQLSSFEVNKAVAEEAAAFHEGEGNCEISSWEGDELAPGGGAGLMELLGLKHKDSGCDDALVVSLIVVTRGALPVPTNVARWQEVADAMTALCGLSSDRIMAVDLTWAPSHDGDYVTRQRLMKDYGNLKPIAH